MRDAGKWFSSLGGIWDVHLLPTFDPGDTPTTLSHAPLAGEAHLLLDGIQDAPHVLIHLQALEQSGFTGKGEKRAWPWLLDPKGCGAQPILLHCVSDTSLLLVTIVGPDRTGRHGDSWTQRDCHYVQLLSSEPLGCIWVLSVLLLGQVEVAGPQRAGLEGGRRSSAGVGITHLHTGHLQVPLSQFSCRYDSRSKH